MKNLFLIVCFLIVSASYSQNLYSKVFGESNSETIIFLHGGPGFNSASFERTTAQKLADQGFRVIVYDRRGEGRSKNQTAEFTFNQTYLDILSLFNQYRVKKATIIGHSFGGIIATLFATKYPEKIKSVILVSAPIAVQKTYETIIEKSKSIYLAKGDSLNLNYIKLLLTKDPKSLEYSSYCLLHAFQNGFYSTNHPTDEAKLIYSTFKSDSILNKYASQTTYQAPHGFWKNEKYTSIDISNQLKELVKNKIKVYGLYGKDDGLFSNEQIKNLQNIIRKSNLKYLERCSHNVFIDQQIEFVNQIKSWAN
jgi:proline iminopeptidase